MLPNGLGDIEMRGLDMNGYVQHQQVQYKRARRRIDKIKILNEFCDVTGYHRKHASRILNHHIVGLREKPLGRKKTYEPEILLTPLKNIWLATDQMCGKRLKAALPLWLPYYGMRFGFLDEKVKVQLLRISAATIDRLLKSLKIKYPKRLGGTKPGYLLKQHIPIKTDQWNEKKPGFVEGDTVAHCGTSLLGNFVWSITVTDIYSGWTENAAMWNKGAYGAMEQIRAIEERLPFPLLGWDSDNGGEFLNYHLLRYFQQRNEPIQFTRSRPYHSGDNAHVEQKNWTHVRQLFGYYRLDNPQMVSLMNDLYQNECSLLHNYFYPAMKLLDKKRIQSKIKKEYETPKTPYQRLLDCEHVSTEQKEALKRTFASLDPFKLKISMEQKLKKIFAYVNLKIRKKTTKI